MKIKSGFAMRNIAGSYIVVPIGETVSEFNGMITLNSTGAFLWDCFKNDITEEKAVELLTGEYDVSDDKALSDIKKFVALLEQNNIIEK